MLEFSEKRVTKLRSFFGWIFLLMLIPIFVFTLMAFGREAQNMKPLDQVLDEEDQYKRYRPCTKQLHV